MVNYTLHVEDVFSLPLGVVQTVCPLTSFLIPVKVTLMPVELMRRKEPVCTNTVLITLSSRTYCIRSCWDKSILRRT